MEVYTMTAAEVEITPADIDWKAAQNDDHETTEDTPVDALVEPNPRDSWEDWTDAFTWEIGPDDAWWDAEFQDRLDDGRLSDWDMLPGLIG